MGGILTFLRQEGQKICSNKINKNINHNEIVGI